MPVAAPTVCRQQRCNTLTYDTYCKQHRAERSKAQDQRRPHAAARLYGNRWRKESKRFLTDHPLCRECKKFRRVEPATVVDHVTPHKGDLALFWDTGNWQPLCQRCHNRKTGKEQKGRRQAPATEQAYPLGRQG